MAGENTAVLFKNCTSIEDSGPAGTCNCTDVKALASLLLADKGGGGDPGPHLLCKDWE